MLNTPINPFIIVGTTKQGKRFRPSDWAERLSGLMSNFGTHPGDKQHIGYSPHVRPGTHEGEKCVFVAAELYTVEPMAYQFLLKFAEDNDLEVVI